MYTDLNRKSQYDITKINAEIVFFSPFKLKEVTTKLSNTLHKNIMYTTKIGGIISEKIQVYPVYASGFNMFAINTGFMDYDKSILTILESLQFINKIGFTNDICDLKIQVKAPYINNRINGPILMLNIDESKLFETWSRFGQSKLYKLLPEYFIPKNIFESKITSNGLASNWTCLNIPNSNRFGLNLTEVRQNIIGINYIGGKDYEKKLNDVISTINLIIEKVQDFSQNKYAMNESAILNNISDRINNNINSIRNYTQLKRNYPNINVLVDLKEHFEIINQRYNEFRDSIFKAIVIGKINEGTFNYNSDTRKLEIAECKIKQGFDIDNINFISCSIMGEFNNCEFNNCNILSSDLKECYIAENNDIRKSKLINCEFSGNNNEIDESVIDSKYNIIHANIKNSVLNGKISYYTSIDGENFE